MLEPKTARFLVVAFFLACAGPVAFGAPAAKDAAREAEDKAIIAATQHGPVDIPLRDQAILHLPKGDIFIPPKEAAIIMRRMGNFPNDDSLGLIFPEGKDNWFIDASFENPGYVACPWFS